MTLLRRPRTRRLLDQLELASGADLAPRFVAEVLGADAEAEIEARAAARAAYASLLDAAGDWGPPGPARMAMEEWRFDDARTEIDAATAWLAERDNLLEEIDSAGLSVPTRLRDRYMQSGGGPEAVEELEAQRAVVVAYRAGNEEASAERNPLVRVGLLAATPPEVPLASARDLFAEGDLRGAAEEIGAARGQLAGAERAGLLRVVVVALGVIVLIALIALGVRRRRAARELR
jgi:hypothetical protein